MPIENRNLTKGTKLTGRYHKQGYFCEVAENAEGKLRYRLQDGREFKSPSAAGMAITGHACDGWVFWTVQTEENATANVQSQESATTETSPAIKTEQLKTTPEPATQTTPSADKNSKKTGVFLVPNQKGVPEGQIRWFCRDCGKSFIASAVEIPGICPAKHQAK
jgi:rubrerythrin